MVSCPCMEPHELRHVVLTGGPGAGKTAVLELVRQSLCKHVKVLPEAAGVVFGGGFPRHDDRACVRAAQLAIYHVQRALEDTGDAHDAAIVLCDRGTVDALAYWPGPAAEFWKATSSTYDCEISRYTAVIHLRTPSAHQGYNRQNPLRTEAAGAAALIDADILEAWAGHPRRYVVEPQDMFLDKAAAVLGILRMLLPDCCSSHLQHAR